MSRWLEKLAPGAFGVILLAAWEALTRLLNLPVYLVPGPSAIGQALVQDAGALLDAALYTLSITLQAFGVAAILGLGTALLFARSRLARAVLYPYAVILQVTPIVSIAPLIIIWVGIDHVERALLILATIVAFFPVLANAHLGFTSVDPNLRDLMRLYGASSWRVFWDLDLPSASPQILSGLKIAGGLALIGAVVAEFVAGSGGSTGLAWRIIESGNRLQIPAMFAALVWLSGLGIALFAVLAWAERAVLGAWHDSARGPEL